MIIWLILIAVSFMSALSLALVVTNEEASRAARQVYRTNGIAGVPVACLTAVTSLILVGLWVWYGISIGDWRFCAIFLIPAICGYIAEDARRDQHDEDGAR